MKSHINLASRKILYNEKPFPYQEAVVPMALGATVVLLILVSLGYALRVHGMKKEVLALVIQRDKIQLEMARLNGEIGSLSRQTEPSGGAAAQQLEAMKELLKTRIPWSDVVREVSFLVPEGVWLTQMESLPSLSGGLLPSATGKTIRFVGVAQSQAAVNLYIAALERSPRYGTVSLLYVQKGGDEGAGVRGVNFELTATLR